METAKTPNLGPVAFEDFSELLTGKVPPQNLELEQIVLGSALLDKDAPNVLVTRLTPETFYVLKHAAIFEAIRELHRKQLPVDMITVRESLLAAGELENIGGVTYLVELTNKVASSANLEFHCIILRRLEVRRQIPVIANKMVGKSFDMGLEPLEILGEFQTQLFDLSASFQRRRSVSSADIAFEELERIENILNKPDGLIGVPTGFAELDRMLNGLQEPDLICIAARPGMGKTGLACSLIRNMSVMRGIPTGIFSLEMSSQQLNRRIVSQEAKVSSQSIADPRRIKAYPKMLQRIVEASEVVADSPIFYNDTPGITIQELAAEARRMVQEDGVKVLFVDYLQLMGNPGVKDQRRENIVGENSRQLKALAKELRVPVVMLSQLSRAVETRGGMKRPQQQDLRDSGSIEQDCDIICFLYRPEYYLFMTDPDGNSTEGLAELIISKHRNGPTGKVRLLFEGKYTQFSDWNSDEGAFAEDWESEAAAEAAEFESFQTGEQTGANDDFPF